MLTHAARAAAKQLFRLSNLLSARSLLSHREHRRGASKGAGSIEGSIEDAARDGPCAHSNFSGTSGGCMCMAARARAPTQRVHSERPAACDFL